MSCRLLHGLGAKTALSLLLLLLFAVGMRGRAIPAEAALGAMHLDANPSVLPLNQSGAQGGASPGFAAPTVSSTMITAYMFHDDGFGPQPGSEPGVITFTTSRGSFGAQGSTVAVHCGNSPGFGQPLPFGGGGLDESSCNSASASLTPDATVGPVTVNAMFRGDLTGGIATGSITIQVVPGAAPQPAPNPAPAPQNQGVPQPVQPAPVSVASGPTVTYSAGWNLVAGPGGTAFPQASGKLYTAQAGDAAYEISSPMAGVGTGRGYWAYFPSGATVTLNGSGVASASITAPPGQWVMVGDPSGTSTVTIRGADRALSFDPISNSYINVTTLSPGHAALAYSSNGGTITLSP